MSTDESSLIQRAKAGDPTAFAEIYDRHQPAIYRYIFYRVGDVTTAEDLTGEVFVRLLERIDTFTSRGRPLLAWLYTIARNLLTDHWRQAGSTTPLPPHEQLEAEGDDPVQMVEQELAQRRLAAALAHLTEDQRQVIILKFIEGFNNAEAAQILDKSVGAVKSLQHRALAALRRILEENGDGGNGR
jgi:RNA polymerase sigma-70 factor (ECF subfamily)